MICFTNTSVAVSVPVAKTKSNTKFVFLGGVCDPTSWRKGIAIPFLEKHNIQYFNPQVEGWDSSMINKEHNAKDTATILLFVIDDSTRAIMSMAEAGYYIGQGRNVVLVLKQYTGLGEDDIAVKDINRGRDYLLNIANKHKVELHDDLQTALNHIKSCE
jgi:hypothetical protein